MGARLDSAITSEELREKFNFEPEFNKDGTPMVNTRTAREQTRKIGMADTVGEKHVRVRAEIKPITSSHVGRAMPVGVLRPVSLGASCICVVWVEVSCSARRRCGVPLSVAPIPVLVPSSFRGRRCTALPRCSWLKWRASIACCNAQHKMPIRGLSEGFCCCCCCVYSLSRGV